MPLVSREFLSSVIPPGEEKPYYIRLARENGTYNPRMELMSAEEISDFAFGGSPAREAFVPDITWGDVVLPKFFPGRSAGAYKRKDSVVRSSLEDLESELKEMGVRVDLGRFTLRFSPDDFKVIRDLVLSKSKIYFSFRHLTFFLLNGFLGVIWDSFPTKSGPPGFEVDVDGGNFLDFPRNSTDSVLSLKIKNLSHHEYMEITSSLGEALISDDEERQYLIGLARRSNVYEPWMERADVTELRDLVYGAANANAGEDSDRFKAGVEKISTYITAFEIAKRFKESFPKFVDAYKDVKKNGPGTVLFAKFLLQVFGGAISREARTFFRTKRGKGVAVLVVAYITYKIYRRIRRGRDIPGATPNLDESSNGFAETEKFLRSYPNGSQFASFSILSQDAGFGSLPKNPTFYEVAQFFDSNFEPGEDEDLDENLSGGPFSLGSVEASEHLSKFLFPNIIVR